MNTVHYVNSPIPYAVFKDGAPTALALVNADGPTIYANSSPSLLGGIPITPGNRILWHAGTPLYVWGTDALQSQLVIIEGADVASMATVGSATTSNASWQTLASLTPPAWDAIFSTAGYSSLVISSVSSRPSSAYTAMTVSVSYFREATGGSLWYETFAIPIVPNGAFGDSQLVSRVRGPFARVSLIVPGGADFDWSVTVAGAVDVIPESYWQSGDNTVGQGGSSRFVQLTQTIPPSTATRTYPGTWAGPATLTFRFASAIASGIFIGSLRAWLSGRLVWRVAVPSPITMSQSFNASLIIPREPVYLDLFQSSGSNAAVEYAIVYEGTS